MDITTQNKTFVHLLDFAQEQADVRTGKLLGVLLDLESEIRTVYGFGLITTEQFQALDTILKESNNANCSISGYQRSGHVVFPESPDDDVSNLWTREGFDNDDKCTECRRGKTVRL